MFFVPLPPPINEDAFQTHAPRVDGPAPAVAGPPERDDDDAHADEPPLPVSPPSPASPLPSPQHGPSPPPNPQHDPSPPPSPQHGPSPPPTPQHSPSPPPSPKFSFADGQRPSCPQATWDPELDNSQRMPGLTPENEAWLAHQKSLKSAACTSVSDDASVPSTAVDSPLDPKAASNDNMVCISDEDEPVLPPRDLANALDSAARKEESTGLMQKQNMVLGLFIYVYFPHWAPRVRRRGQFHVLKFDCLKFWWVQGIKDMKKNIWNKYIMRNKWTGVR